MSSKSYEKVCEVCGKSFIAKRKDARYCCQECGIQAAKNRTSGKTTENATPTNGNTLQGVPPITPKPITAQKDAAFKVLIEGIKGAVREEVKQAMEEYVPRSYFTTVNHKDTSASWLGVASGVAGNFQNGAINNKLDKVLKALDGLNRQLAGLSLENKVLKRALKSYNIICKYADNQFYKGYVFGHKDGEYWRFEDPNGREVFVEKMHV